jgi:rhomboid protease GluP
MDSAPPTAATPSPGVSFAVAYQDERNANQNPDLYEQGIFTARDDGTFRFSGRRRALVGGEKIALEFAAADITNVDSNGRAVWFTTTKGRAGAQKNPFLFFCRDTDEARAVVSLLPAAVDAHFVATATFQEKLRQLPGARNPWLSLTGAIIAVNVVVFVVMAGWLDAGWTSVKSMAPYVRYGANHGAVTTNGEWWRLGTSMFMHYGIVHLAFNMWALFQAGHLMERLQGRAAYVVSYLASGVAGGLLSLIWHGLNPVWSAGASGAVFGVYGAMLGFMLRQKQTLPKSLFDPLMRSAMSFGAYNLVFGLIVPGIDNSAHIGGFVGGLAFGWLLALPVDREVRERLRWRRLGVAGIAFAVMVAAGVAAAPRFPHSSAPVWRSRTR